MNRDMAVITKVDVHQPKRWLNGAYATKLSGNRCGRANRARTQLASFTRFAC